MPFQEYSCKKPRVGIQLTRYLAYIHNDFSPQSFEVLLRIAYF